MRERRDLRGPRRPHVLAPAQQPDRPAPAARAQRPAGAAPRRGFDQILPLDNEQPELVAPAALVQLADELQPLVVAGGDQSAVASAAFACSTIWPNAPGSLTARSASTLRSSSMPAFEQPFTNWLYERPFARAAALIRMIQRRRKSRFLFLRSR